MVKEHFYKVFLISFAMSNTAQPLADLTFSPHFLTSKMQFSMLVSPFFPFLVGPLPTTRILFKMGCLQLGLEFSMSFFLLPEMQTQLYIFDFRNLLCTQVLKFLSSVDFTALRLKKAKHENPENADLFIFPFSLIKILYDVLDRGYFL